MKITLKQLILIFIWIKLDLTVSNRGGLHLSEQRRQNAPRWWKSWKRKNGFMSQTCHSLQAVIRGKKDQLLLQDFCRFAAPPTPLLKAERTRTAARKSSIVRGHHTEPARYSSQELLHSWRVINISLHPLSSPQSARFGHVTGHSSLESCPTALRTRGSTETFLKSGVKKPTMKWCLITFPPQTFIINQYCWKKMVSWSDSRLQPCDLTAGSELMIKRETQYNLRPPRRLMPY